MQCLHRWQKVLNPELVKGPWTPEVGPPTQLIMLCMGFKCPLLTHGLDMLQEDEKIIELVQQLGPTKWSLIAQELPGRIGKQCRER